MRRNRRLSGNGGRGMRDGFTLVEVLVALAIGTMAILGARSVFGALLDHADRINDAAWEQDSVANGERMLRSLVSQVDLGRTGHATFSGDEKEVRFRTWCPTPDGWQERCDVRLLVRAADSVGAVPRIVAQFSVGEAIPLLDVGSVTTFAYLLDPGAGGRWVRTWGAGITVPMAIGIMSERDTLIVRIGDRG